MKNQLFFVFALFMFSWAVYPTKVEGQESVCLFNGKDLAGWYTYLQKSGRDHDPLGVFSVHNGILRITGEEWGCITTHEEYENYHLVIEYKWGEKTYSPRFDKARDGGILVHSQGEDGGYEGIWMHSIECQMIEGGTGDIIVVGDGTEAYSVTSPVAEAKQGNSYVFNSVGSLVKVNNGRINWYGRDPNWQDRKGFRGSWDIERPLGEWNKLEIIANGSDLTYYLNGVLVNRTTNVSPAKGRIQIQSEGAEMFVRKIALTTLPDYFRFIYNCDSDNLFLRIDTPMTVEKLYPYVDSLATSGFTTLFMCPNLGMPMNFPSKVGEMIGEKISPDLEATLKDDAPYQSIERLTLNLRKLVSEGHDPLGSVLNRAKSNGMETFVTFRPNEVHLVEQQDHLIFEDFWRKHPEWRIGQFGDSLAAIHHEILGPRTSEIVGKWLPGGLNFALPEVRAYKLAQLREICERYEIDGLEIDFQRFPMYFKIGEETENIPTMTKWVKEVRKMVDEVNETKGSEIKLTARIMALPEQNIQIGLDPVSWVREQVIDFVVVSHYLHNNFPLPIEQYRALFSDRVPIYASLEYEPTLHHYRNAAYPLWRGGINGISIFNFGANKAMIGEGVLFSELKSVGFPMGANGQILLVANKHSNTLSFIDPKTLAVDTTISTGLNPREIILTPDQRYAYLSNYAPPGNTISVIDLLKRQHIKQISTGAYGRIHGAAMAPDGRFAYFTAGQSGYVIEVDTRTHEVSRRIPTHGKISHIVYISPDGTKLYTANIESEDISVIDRKSGDLLQKIKAGKGVEGMAFTPDGRFLWAMNQTGGSVMIIDLAIHSVIETFDCPGMPARIRFTPDGKRAVIAHWIQDGQVSILDVASRKIIKKLRVGKYAIGVEISADGKRAFVGCEDANKAEQIGEGEEEVEHTKVSDGLHVIDLEKLEVIGTVKTGLGPDPMVMWYSSVELLKN